MSITPLVLSKFLIFFLIFYIEPHIYNLYNKLKKYERKITMEVTTLYVRSTARDAVLYWEKPIDTEKSDSYQILIDEILIGTTTETYLVISDLKPDTRYRSTVLRNGSLFAQTEFCTEKIKRRIDVTAPPFSAIPDGTTMNTNALQKAFDQCGPLDEVYFPPGIYLTGALTLHNHMSIYLDENAILQGSSLPEDYLPRIKSRFEGTELECYQSLLNLGVLDHNSKPSYGHVRIGGKGTISGGGALLAERIIDAETQRLKEYLESHKELVASCENSRTIPGRVRGRLINLSNCCDVRITGLTLQNGASWNVHMIYCDDIVTDHCTFRSEGIWNGDGWDPDSSSNCTLFACDFYTEDDSVAIKSGKNPEGNQISRPCSHIRIFSCNSFCGHGICIGSEMSGGVSDVHIWDCDIARSSNGFEIKGTTKRGGFVKNILVQDCHFPRLLIHSVPYNNDGIPAPHPPVFENFSFHRIVLTGKKIEHGFISKVEPLDIQGFSAPDYEVKKIHLKNCIFPQSSTFYFSLCSELNIENISFKM